MQKVNREIRRKHITYHVIIRFLGSLIFYDDIIKHTNQANVIMCVVR